MEAFSHSFHQSTSMTFLTCFSSLALIRGSDTTNNFVFTGESATTVLEELLGGTLTLPCNVTPPEGDSVALILWYKDNLSEAIFTYDSRGGGGPPADNGDPTNLQKGLEGRANFHLGDPAFLSLKNATLNDSGNYECRVDFLKAPSKTTYLKLIVVDPPNGLLIKRIEGDLISFTVTANLGDPLRLSCVATGGQPRPQVKWSVNRDITDVTWDAFNEAMTQNDLILLNLTRDLHQAKLICQASNSNISKPLLKEVILLLNLPPKSVKISGIPEVLHSGRRYSAKCDVVGARPDPIITWTLLREGETPQKVSGIIKSKMSTSKKVKKKNSVETVNFTNFPAFEKGASGNKLISSDLWKVLYKDFKQPTKREIIKTKRTRRKDGIINFYKYKEVFAKLVGNLCLPGSTNKSVNIMKTNICVHNKNVSLLKTEIYYYYKLISQLSTMDYLSNLAFTNSSSLSPKVKYQMGEIFTQRYNLTQKVRTRRQSLLDIDATNTNYVKSSNKNKNNHESIEIMVDSWLNDAELICSAVSSALTDRPVKSVKKLNVHYAPRLEISLGATLRQDTIQEEMDVYFQCYVDANPPVPHITWLHNEVEVRHSPRDGVLISAEHLVLQKVKRQWSGQFTCRGANGVSAATSPPFDLKVMFIPVCVNTVSLVWAGIGEEVVVPCRVVAHPSNITFHWTLTNSVTQERVSPDRVIVLGLESQLRYRPEKPHDYGRLQCWAENVLGRQKEPCVVTVKTAGSPGPPTNCSVYNQTWMGFDIACIDQRRAKTSEDITTFTVVAPKKVEKGSSGPEGDGGIINGGVAKLMVGRDRIRYLLSIRENDRESLVYNVSGESGKFRVTGLTPGLDYIITVSRFNNHGRSREVTLEALTLRAAENRMREEKVTSSGSNYKMVGGVTGALLVLLILSTAAFFVCLRGRNRGQGRATDRIPLPSSASPTGTDDVKNYQECHSQNDTLRVKSNHSPQNDDESLSELPSSILCGKNLDSSAVLKVPEKDESSLTSEHLFIEDEIDSTSSQHPSNFQTPQFPHQTRGFNPAKHRLIRGLTGENAEKESFL